MCGRCAKDGNGNGGCNDTCGCIKKSWKGKSPSPELADLIKTLKSDEGFGLAKRLIVKGDRKTNKIRITAPKLLQKKIERVLRKNNFLPLLVDNDDGIDDDSEPVGGGSGFAFEGKVDSSATPAANNNNNVANTIKIRKDLLLNSKTTKENIVDVLGTGLEGSFTLFAHHVTHNTKCWPYGGFIRDFIYRGDVLKNSYPGDAGMDLDVGLPKDGSLNGTEACASMRPWAKSVGLNFSRFGADKGTYVKEVFFKCLDGVTEFPIEFVDAYHFAKSDNRIDFDVR